MTLTMSNGPFGPHPSGHFNFRREGPAHVLYWEDSPRRLRVEFGGETIADSRRAKLLHETGLLPTYYFPMDDVRQARLTATDHTTHCPFKGDASYWTVSAGDKVAENAVWGYPHPLDSAPDLAGYVAFYWNKMDAWFEEDEEIFVHARDPYHRVDVVQSSRRVKVSLGDTVLAESSRPKILFETGLPPRYYLPEADVHLGRLTASDTRTQCPYKGTTSRYWSLGTDEGGRDIAWCYDEPIAEVGGIAGLVCFYDEKVDVDLDGQRQERPRSPFSPPSEGDSAKK